MNSKLKGTIHTIINIVGNGAILAFLPSPISIYAILAFNVLQVVYAYLDPTYTVNLLKMGKIDINGDKIR
jgi:hypothetical protein